MDKTQIAEFVDLMVGWRAVGVAGDEEVAVPRSPELRAFIVARLGNDIPPNGYVTTYGHKSLPAFAAMLREVAECLDPRATLKLPPGGLTSQEKYLLEWLSKEDSSAYGECCGANLDLLVNVGLARYSANPPSAEDRVSLTEAGHIYLAALRLEAAHG